MHIGGKHEMNKLVWRRLREEKRLRGIKHDWAAQQLGVGGSTLTRIERDGSGSFDHLHNYALKVLQSTVTITFPGPILTLTPLFGKEVIKIDLRPAEPE